MAVNGLWLASLLFGVPGNWLMVASTVLMAWWQQDRGMFSPWTLVAVALLAAVGELLEFLSGMAGARRAGGTRRGSVGALAGGVVGAIAGTLLIPVPLLGTLAGAALGAFTGSMTMERTGGRPIKESFRAGLGAGAGQVLGTACKLAIGAIIWVTVAVAAYWP